MHHSSEHWPARSLALGGRDPVRRWPARVMRRCPRPEMSVSHSHGLKDSLPCECVQALPCYSLDQFAQDHESDVRVDELGARRRAWRQLGDPLPGGFGTMLEILQGIVRNQARPMSQEVLDRDLGLAMVSELGQELGDAVAQAQLALLDQEHGGG